MNFQAVEQANGNDVTLNAVATSLGNTEYTKQKGTPFMKCKLTDANGRTEDVTIWQGKGHPIPGSMQGTTLSFNLSCKINGQYTNYGGFWNASAQVAPLPPQPQQGPRQAAGQPQQPARQPQGNDRAEGMVRHGVVCAYISAGVEPEVQTVNYWTQFIMTGQAPPPPGQQPTPADYPENEQPPWES